MIAFLEVEISCFFVLKLNYCWQCRKKNALFMFLFYLEQHWVYNMASMLHHTIAKREKRPVSHYNMLKSKFYDQEVRQDNNNLILH